MKKHFLLLSLLLGTVAAYAIPNQISYQGSLAASDGAPLDTTVAVTFVIYDAPSGGAILWSETHPAISIANGLFAVQIGAVVNLPDIFNANRWLGTTIGGDSEMSPRQQITSVAHAYRVGTVDGANGGTIAGNTVISGKLNAGTNNGNNGMFAMVMGQSNQANGSGSAVTGGSQNTASGGQSVVSGGTNNHSVAISSAVGGGSSNTASGTGSVISGGTFNTTSGDFSAVGGGNNNMASDFAAVNGGSSNNAMGTMSAIGGGHANWATASGAIIGGGGNNRARGSYSVVAGGGGSTAADSNLAIADWSTVGGGAGNYASGFSSTIAGGARNIASGSRATIGGGRANRARGEFAIVAGGGGPSAADSNAANAAYGVVSGGRANRVTGTFGIVAGGQGNEAGLNGFVAGGSSNRATGNGSFAAGFSARANHFGSFVWGTSTLDSTVSFNDWTFTARCANGARFYSTLIGTGSGVQLPAGGGAWANLCDVNQKDLHGSVNTADVLAKVAALPLHQWSYKSQSESIRHIGPTAQDFYGAFGLGDNNATISTLDPDGVALAAIQELARRTDQIEQLNLQLAQLQAQVQTLLADRMQSTTLNQGTMK